MRKFFITAVMMLPFLITGCSKEEKPKIPDTYMVGVYDSGSVEISRDGYDVKDNGLYILLNDGIAAINRNYGQTIAATDDTEALANFGQALEELKSLKTIFDSAASSGKDFGASQFSTSCFCVLYKDGVEIKHSESFPFEYTSNTRVINPNEIKINSSEASVSGTQSIQVADTPQELGINGWKLYESNGNPSTSDIIKDVKVSEKEDGTFFDVTFNATKGVSPGEFYILVTCVDKADTSFIIDILIKVTHTTK